MTQSLLIDGGSLILKLENDIYRGAKETGTCLSSLRGVRYATSEVSIQSDVLRSFDRGYDSMHNQVWGSEYGPYVFKKLSRRE